MTDRFVRDDVLEAVLRSRAGEGAPADLHAVILAAVAAEGPRGIPGRRRGTGHPWRLLAVAAVLLGTIGTALFVGMSRQTQDPQPSQRAIVPSLAASPSTPPQPSSTPTPVFAQAPSPSSPPSQLPATVQPCMSGATPPATDSVLGHWDTLIGATTPEPTGATLSGFTGLRDDGTFDPNAGLDVLDPDRGRLRRVVAFAEGVTWRSIASSPTGSALAFSVGGGYGVASCTALYVTAGDRLVQVTAVHGALGFSWSPDGASIAVNTAVIRSDGTTLSFASSCVDACTFNNGPSVGSAWSPWSPDGRHLAMTREGDSLVSVLSLDTGEVSDVPGSAGEFWGWLDSHTLRLVKGPANGAWHWAAVGLDGSQSKATVGVTTTTVSRLTVAPDFSAAAGSACLRCPFVVAGSACVRCPSVDVDGGPARTVWTGKAPLAMTWSPDSKWIAFSVRGSQAGTWIVGVDGKGLRRISTTVLAPLAWGSASTR